MAREDFILKKEQEDALNYMMHLMENLMISGIVQIGLTVEQEEDEAVQEDHSSLRESSQERC